MRPQRDLSSTRFEAAGRPSQRRQAAPRSLPAAALLALGLLWSLAVGGCGSSGPVVKVSRAAGAKPGRLRLLVLYPVDFDQKASPAEVYRKTLDLVSGLGGGRHLAILGPWEFDLRAPRSDELSTASNALLVARRLGFAPAEVGLLRVRLLRQVQRGSATIYSTKGERRGKRAAQDLRFTAVGDLRTFYPARPLAELRCTVRHDPFGEHPDWDPTPAARIAVRAIGAEVRRLLAPRSSPAPLGLVTIDSARPLMDLEDGEGGQTLAEEVAAAGLLMGELKLWRVFQYLDPSITTAAARRLAAAPPGALVKTTPDGALGELLRAGDLIVGAQGEPLRHGYQLQRAWQRSGGETLELSVRRAGAEQAVELKR